MFAFVFESVGADRLVFELNLTLSIALACEKKLCVYKFSGLLSVGTTLSVLVVVT